MRRERVFLQNTLVFLTIFYYNQGCGVIFRRNRIVIGVYCVKKRYGLMLALVVLVGMLATACSAIPGMDGSDDDTGFGLGDKVKTEWFNFTVNSIEVVDDYEGYTTDEGYRLAVCDVTLKSIVDDTTPMYWSDFILIWTDEGGEFPEDVDPLELPGSYPIEYTSDKQFPDEYDLAAGETLQADLVFDVPVGCTKAAVLFQEIYEGATESSYKEGDYYLVMLDIPQ